MGTTVMEGNGRYINSASAKQHKFLSPLFICSFCITNAGLHYDLKQIYLPFYSWFSLMCNDTNSPCFGEGHSLKKLVLLLIFQRSWLQVSLIKIIGQYEKLILASMCHENFIQRELIPLMCCWTSEKESLMTKVFWKESWQW